MKMSRSCVIGIVAAILFMGAMLALPSPAAAPTNQNPIITVRITAIQDTFINQASPSTNYCTSSGAQVIGTGAGTTARTLFQFSIAAIPSNALIVEAKFNAFISQASMQSSNGLGTLQFYQLSSAWSVCTVTWNNQPTQSSPLGFQYISNATVIQPLPFAFDITQFVVNWQASPSTNNGIEAAFQSDTSAPIRVLSWFSTQGGVQKPFVTVSYQLPTATVYPAYYCSGGPCETMIASGSGLPAYLFSVSYAENNGTLRPAIRPDLIPTNLSTWLRLQVKDFFNNVLYDANQSVTSWQYLWKVAIPYGILQVFSQRDAFTTMSIQPAGGTAMIIDIGPRGYWVMPLRSSVKYWFNFTLLDGRLVTVGTVNASAIMGQKISYIVNGTTLTQVSTNVNNVGYTANATYGVTTGVGNVLLAPHGIDLFGTFYTARLGFFSIPLTPFLFSYLTVFFGWIGWAYAYRPVLTRDVRNWPRRPKLLLGFVLVPLSAVLIIGYIVHASGGSVVIPVPWVPLH